MREQRSGRRGQVSKVRLECALIASVGGSALPSTQEIGGLVMSGVQARQIAEGLMPGLHCLALCAQVSRCLCCSQLEGNRAALSSRKAASRRSAAEGTRAWMTGRVSIQRPSKLRGGRYQRLADRVRQTAERVVLLVLVGGAAVLPQGPRALRGSSRRPRQLGARNAGGSWPVEQHSSAAIAMLPARLGPTGCAAGGGHVRRV